MGAPHRFSFEKIAGFDQVVIQTGEDLAGIKDLDAKHWAALACPVRGLEFDARTLALLDADGDGRIRHPDVVSAVNWTLMFIKDPEALTRGEEVLPLSAIRTDTEQGKALAQSVQKLLAGQGREKAEGVSVSEAEKMADAFFSMPLNGDGIATEKSADSPALASAIADIITCMGSETDLSGEPGLTEEKCDQFLADAADYLFWRKKAENDPGRLLPFGRDTEGAYAAFTRVRDKVEDFFTRCKLAALDPEAAGPLSGGPEAYARLAAGDLSRMPPELSELPLAPVSGKAPLPLAEAVNPAWAEALRAFSSLAAAPFLGQAKVMTENQWRAVCSAFAPYEAWMAEKPAPHMERITPGRVDELVAKGIAARIKELVAADRAVAPEAEAVLALEKLTRFHRYLFEFVQNFVNFAAFYKPKHRAAFQAGTLRMDGRACRLCVPVEDMEKHAAAARRAGIFLLYCECTRGGGEERRFIAAAVTDGGTERLGAGRRGLFFDREGREWDAVVVKAVEHPLCPGRALWRPWESLGRLLGKGAAETEAAMDDVRGAGRAAGLSVGLGLILAALVLGFSAYPWYRAPLAALGLALLISVASALRTRLALGRRSLGPLLDAGGWAVNGRARIGGAFARSLTVRAAVPREARRPGADPYGKATVSWWLVGLVVLAALAVMATLYLTR